MSPCSVPRPSSASSTRWRATRAAAATACDTGKIGQAFFLTDAVGLAVLLAASTAAVVLMLRRRVAFWVPVVGIAAQVGLVALSFGLLDQVVP